MPHIEMTPEEANRYGGTLSIWEKLVLLQAWAPLVAFAQRFVTAPDAYAKSVIVGECCEWLASKTDSKLDDELVALVSAVMHTPQGEALVRWVIAKAESKRA